MSCLPTLPDSGNVIFSPESESGPMLCVAQDGRMTVPSGQVPVPASLSARQAKEKGLLTSGTCGPRSSISSASAGLSQSLASRLRAVTALHGSTLYRLTWKERATPAGRWIPALRASVRRISDNGSTGWPTPTGNSYTGAGSGKREGGLNLQTAVELSGWPTPRARDFHTEGKGKYSPSLSRLAGTLAGWPTPRSVESGHSTGNPARAFNRKSRLEDMVFLAGWATPSARDHGQSGEGVQPQEPTGGHGFSGGLGNTVRTGLEGHAGHGDGETGRQKQDRSASTTGRNGVPLPVDSFWRNADWLLCRDGKWRPVEPGSCPLAHGATNRVGRLRGYGNAVVALQAEAFIRAFMDIL